MALSLEEEDEALEDKPTLAEDLMRTNAHTMTGSTFMITTILQIHVLTSFVPTIPLPLPISLTDPHETTDQTPAQGMFEA